MMIVHILLNDSVNIYNLFSSNKREKNIYICDTIYHSVTNIIVPLIFSRQ